MSTLAASAHPGTSPAIRRLSALANLSPTDVEQLRVAAGAARTLPSRREFVTEGEPIREPRIVLSGWACRTHVLRDGRRQVLSFLLPGDLLGVCGQANPVAPASVLAVTEVVICSAPNAADGGGLAEAYAMSAAIGEHYLLRQVTRLGRLNAYERLADWLLEIRERLALAGLADGGQFAMPLTQEVLGDTLGLTSVHVNRTIQALRSDGLLTLRGGQVSLPDVPRLAALAEHRPVHVAG